MKTRKILLSALLTVTLLTSAAFSANVEDALTACPEESFYAVLRLDNAGGLFKWLFSKENIDTFMPLVLASESSNEIIGVIEMVSAFVENTPLQSVALLAGVQGDKSPVPFFKMAFTVKPEAEAIYNKIADGSAEAVDVAKLMLGKDNPILSLAESMIKVEKGENNILRVDNELYLKAHDNMIIAGLSADDINSSISALANPDERLFSKLHRRFAPKDFAWVHMDLKTIAMLDDDKEVDFEEFAKFVAKPLNIEYGFMRVPGRFLMSTAVNVHEAIAPQYLEKIGYNREYPLSDGGNIDISNGGKNAPLFAFGSVLNVAGFSFAPEGQELWKLVATQAKKIFNIEEEDLAKLFNGKLSLIANDNVSVEGIKVPAFYITLTPEEGTADKIFALLEKSSYFTKAQEGLLQVDPSLSPVGCFIKKEGNALKIDVANIENISSTPELKQDFSDLMTIPSMSSLWIDFAGIQSWVLAPENGLMALLEPLAKLSGNGEIFDAGREILQSKFSVPSMSTRADSVEVVHFDFVIDEEVKTEEGLFAKLVKLGKKFIPGAKPEAPKEEAK